MGFLNLDNRQSTFFTRTLSSTHSIKTIIIEKICNEFPDMYIMIACIGICFAGARAISHAFFNFNVFISIPVGGFRVDACDFFDTVRDAEKPGGSGMEEAFLGLGRGPSFSCTAHRGGGGVTVMLALFGLDL